ncbi:FAD-dependent monooxygenase [Streptomyces auratus AGR0001]|uniref:FAD-dependent monooxygenase n=1 Tax=Streptomyces auratus AGR0001 TaxID=1160718 RepID=A0A8B1NLQ3_9ACTN|nr:FAD-dependent monooxygenase [Streptomyces auratus]QTZ92027.1 FAD-dependent monooxygenase [Streptomyces auratus AGR0001]
MAYEAAGGHGGPESSERAGERGAVPSWRRSVLISGASVAGPALAYWLGRYGFRTTVVEVAPALRGGGFAVDFRGTAHLQVLERMGVLEDIKSHSTGGGAPLSFIDGQGHPLASMPAEVAGGEVEILRSDLSRILYEHSLAPSPGAAPGGAPEYVFGDSLSGLTQTADGVHATFERGAPRTFDLVIGADGQHSTVRRLAFGPEAEFVSHLGYYVAAWDLPEDAGDLGARQVGYGEPGRLATVGRVPRRDREPGYTGESFCVFAAEELSYDRRDLRSQKAAVAAAFEGAGWRTPEVIGSLRGAGDLYFDSISRVDVPTWSTGRITLLGDAAHGATVGGMGTGSAVVGAYVLAGELALADGNHATAFARYEQKLRPYVTRCQEGGRGAGEFLAPPTQQAMDARNALLNDPSALAAMLGEGQNLSAAIELADYPSLVEATATVPAGSMGGSGIRTA